MEADCTRSKLFELCPEDRRPLAEVRSAQVGSATGWSLHNVGEANALLRGEVVGV